MFPFLDDICMGGEYLNKSMWFTKVWASNLALLFTGQKTDDLNCSWDIMEMIRVRLCWLINLCVVSRLRPELFTPICSFMRLCSHANSHANFSMYANIGCITFVS